MDFELPIQSGLLDGKSITMRESVTIEDVNSHLSARAKNPQEEIVQLVAENGGLYDGSYLIASLSVRLNQILFSNSTVGVEVQDFFWN